MNVRMTPKDAERILNYIWQQTENSSKEENKK